MSSQIERLRAALEGRYDVLREIGAGGMATVYLAEDLRHRRRVAIKVMLPELAASLASSRFHREITISAGLQHPHIVGLFDSGDADGLLYYVMPFVEGETLRERLMRESQLDIDEALTIARQIAEALSYAHARGVVHRDIKPANILLSGENAMLADFGVARALDESGSSKLTSTGLPVGSAHYMSPEQADGLSVHDARVDIYSLGCVLYEMLVGEPPFTGKTGHAIIARAMAGQIPSVRVVRRTVPESIDTAIETMLQPVPADRFRTADKVLEALSDLDGVAPRGTRSSRRQRPQWRRLWPIAAGIAGLALAGGFVVDGILRRAPPTQSALANQTERLIVLPFENRGERGDEYFTEGVVEELTSRLARAGDLQVIAPTTARQLSGPDVTLEQIRVELGVDYVLLGTVRWQRSGEGPDRVRVTPRLVRAADQGVTWTDDFDAVLTDIFAVQDSIAAQVTRAIGSSFHIADRPRMTANIAAYDAYLQGNGYFRTGRARREDMGLAIDAYERAATIDSTFVEPLWELVKAYSYVILNWQDLPNGAATAGRHLERAISLAPDATGTHIARGWYRYWALGDYEGALEHFEVARAREPGNTEVTAALGYVKRRLGRWDEALDHLLEAFELDPRQEVLALGIGRTYLRLGRLVEAGRYLDLAISIDPNGAGGYRNVLLHALLTGAGPAEIERLVRDTRARVGDEWKLASEPGALTIMSIIAAERPEALRDVLRPRYGVAPEDRLWQLLVDAALAEQAGELEEARDHYEGARIVLERLREENPDNSFVHALLGYALAGIGEAARAVESSERAVALEPVERDAMDTWPLEVLARVHARLGNQEQALDLLERLTSIPSLVGPGILRRDPTWDGLREHPRFAALLAED